MIKPLAEMFVKYRLDFESKWNLSVFQDNMKYIWASRNKDQSDVTMIMIFKDGNYNFADKKIMPKQCFDEFTDLVLEMFLMESIENTYREKHANVTEKDIITAYMISTAVPRPKARTVKTK